MLMMSIIRLFWKSAPRLFDKEIELVEEARLQLRLLDEGEAAVVKARRDRRWLERAREPDYMTKVEVNGRLNSRDLDKVKGGLAASRCGKEVVDCS